MSNMQIKIRASSAKNSSFLVPQGHFIAPCLSFCNNLHNFSKCSLRKQLILFREKQTTGQFIQNHGHALFRNRTPSLMDPCNSLHRCPDKFQFCLSPTTDCEPTKTEQNPFPQFPSTMRAGTIRSCPNPRLPPDHEQGRQPVVADHVSRQFCPGAENV